MFADPRGLAAVTAALSLLILGGCGRDESGSSRAEGTPSAAASSSAPTLDAVADSFVSLGTTSQAGPRWADRVSVYIGGEESRQLAAAEAAEREPWSMCPPSAVEYAMRKCPVSPFRAMDLLAQEGGTVVYEDKVPTKLGCDIVAALPEWESFSTITIRPDKAHRSCFSDFAITLYVDDQHRINAVNFTLGSP